MAAPRSDSAIDTHSSAATSSRQNDTARRPIPGGRLRSGTISTLPSDGNLSASGSTPSRAAAYGSLAVRPMMTPSREARASSDGKATGHSRNFSTSGMIQSSSSGELIAASAAADGAGTPKRSVRTRPQPLPAIPTGTTSGPSTSLHQRLQPLRSQPTTPNPAPESSRRLSGPPRHSSRASIPQAAQSTRFTLNIHKAEAFGGTQAVMDYARLGWAQVGDVIRVRGMDDQEVLGKLDLNAASGLDDDDDLGAWKPSKKRRKGKGKGKGDFYFRIEDSQEETLKKLNTWSGLSVVESVASVFGFVNRQNIEITKVPPESVEADFIELNFSGQYRGRADMWRLGMALEGKCVHVREKVEYTAGNVKADVKALYINGKQVMSALVTARTKTIYRSKSAQSFVFLQLCREMHEFDEDGERYYEKALYGFLPELFTRWKTTQANHVVTFILFARVYYSEEDVDHLKQLGTTGTDALRHDPHMGYYKDFYKVIVDAEHRADWFSLLSVLKQEVMDTHSDILLNHHLEEDESKEAKIIGKLSFAHEGNILEALNIVINPFEESYIDRDLFRTGLSMIMITPGSGHFKVNKHLLRLTTERVLEHGICLDLVNLTQVPLHTVPLFSFFSTAPDGPQAADTDPLYHDGQDGTPGTLFEQHYALAFWVYCSFYSKSHDKPFSMDRFIPRCKMYEVQMLGLLDHDLTEVSIPGLELPVAEQEASAGTDRLALRQAMLEYDSTSLSTGNVPQFLQGMKGLSSHGSFGSLRAVTASGSQLYSTSYQSQRLPTFREGSDGGSHPSSPGGRRRDSPQSLASPHSPLNTTHMVAKSGVSPQRSIRTAIAPSVHSSTSKTPGSRTPVGNADPAARPASTPGLSKKMSKASLNGKASFPRSLFSLFTRVMPSEPAAAVESVARQAVSSHNSPTAGALGEARAISRSSSPSLRPRAKTQDQPTPVIQPLAAAPEPKPATAPQVQQDISTLPIAIVSKGRAATVSRRRRSVRAIEDGDETVTEKRRLSTDVMGPSSLPQISSGSWRAQLGVPAQKREAAFSVNPCRPFDPKVDRSDQSRSWRHGIPKATFQHQVKWDSLCAPACLPLTNEFLPKEWELSKQYELSTHEVDVDTSFLLRPASAQELPVAVLREMASQRLSQNFQFVTLPRFRSGQRDNSRVDDLRPSAPVDWRLRQLKEGGASEVLRNHGLPLYLSTHNYVHVLTPLPMQNTISVECFTRKIRFKTNDYDYDCLIWPKQRTGYHHAKARFRFPDLANRKAFSYLDRLVTGKVHSFTDDLRYWRTRFILFPSDVMPQKERVGPDGKPLKLEELHIQGAASVLDVIAKQRWQDPHQAVQPPPPKILPTWLDPSACILDETLMGQLEALHKSQHGRSSKDATSKDVSAMALSDIAAMMRDSKTGLRIGDLWWQRIQYTDAFTGEAFVDWLLKSFANLSNRDKAVECAKDLYQRGLIEHATGSHDFIDGYYYYRLKDEFASRSRVKKPQRWFAKSFLRDSAAARSPESTDASMTYRVAAGNPFGLTPPSAHSGMTARKRKIVMSQTMVIDLHTKAKKTDRGEGAILHSDIIHNPANGFHFELNWLGVSIGLVEESRLKWCKEAEKWGLRLVEAPVEQIKDIPKKYAYRSCFPIKLALAPPAVADLDLRLPEAIRTAYFFEYAILTQKFGFVLDVEANTRYPDDVVVEYSYRKAVFDHSQFVHKSGLALVQCIGGTEGFLWSHNRLFFSSQNRMTQTSSSESYRAAHSEAERMCDELDAFCQDSEALAAFYESILPPLPEDLGEASIIEEDRTGTIPPESTPALQADRPLGLLFQ